MGKLGYDSLKTIGRTGWNPSADGQNWTQSGAAYTASTSASGGQLTGQSAIGYMTLGSNTPGDGEIAVNVQVSSVNDQAGIVFHFSGISNHYRARFGPTNFNLFKVFTGTVTNLTNLTNNFVLAANTHYTIRVRTIGSTLYAKIWQVGTLEPAAWTATATDSTFTSGNFGVSYNATNAAHTATFDSFWSQTYPFNANDNPYGVTILTKVPGSPLPQMAQVIGDCQTLGVTWIRLQDLWQKIEGTQGVYTWTALDDFVTRCNNAGINAYVTIQNAPAWYLTTPARLCYQSSTVTDYMPDVGATINFTQIVAQRYNGQSTGLLLQAIEVGNEDYDDNTDGGNNASSPCRTPNWYTQLFTTQTPNIQQVVKGTNQSIIFGTAALLKKSITHIQTWVQGLYSAGIASQLEYINIHPYSVTGQPPSYGSGDIPSFPQFWGAVQQVNVTNGDPTMPIWITEYGSSYLNSYQQSAMTYTLDSARTSTICKKYFWYTIGNDDVMSLTSGGAWDGTTEVYRPIFTTYQNYITAHPNWNAPASGPSVPVPAASRRNGAGASTKRRDGIDNVASKRRDGLGLAASARRDGASSGTPRRDGVIPATERRG